MTYRYYVRKVNCFMNNDNNIQGIGVLRPDAIKFSKLNFELPAFKPVFEFNKPSEPVKKEKNISKELHDSWSKVVPKLSQEFFDKLTAMSQRLNCNPEDLAAIIFNESKFNPKAKGGKYHGLIQMDNTALKTVTAYAFKTQGENCKLDKNITMAKYTKLSREEQLKYAEAYLKFRIDEKKLTGKKLSGGQLWTLIKRPASIKDKNFVKKIQQRIDSTKKIPLKYETPYSLKHAD